MISKDDARKEVKKLIDKYEDYKQKGEMNYPNPKGWVFVGMFLA